MTSPGRLNAILELVTERGTVSLSEITSTFDISVATARRALTVLAEQRLLTRTHGGAVSLGTAYELPMQYKATRSAESKVAIARAVAGLVPRGSTVGLNGGTTTTEVARALGRSDHLAVDGDQVGLTVVTNALNIGFELSVRPHIRMVVTGGVARRQSYELVGPLVRESLKTIALDVAVLGVDGLSEQFGATTLHEGEAEVGRAFTETAVRVIVVADSSKMNRLTFARMFALDAIDVIVTDLEVPAPVSTAFARAGVEVVLA